MTSRDDDRSFWRDQEQEYPGPAAPEYLDFFKHAVVPMSPVWSDLSQRDRGDVVHGFMEGFYEGGRGSKYYQREMLDIAEIPEDDFWDAWHNWYTG